jgi:hypothetical protein
MGLRNILLLAQYLANNFCFTWTLAFEETAKLHKRLFGKTFATYAAARLKGPVDRDA